MSLGFQTYAALKPGPQLRYMNIKKFHFSHKLPLSIWTYLILLVPSGRLAMEAMLEGLLMSAHVLNLHVLTASVNCAEGDDKCNKPSKMIRGS